MGRHHIRYRGSPTFAGLFVSMLEKDGVGVEWERPTEERGVADVAGAILIGIVANGAYDVIKAAVERFRERYPRADIEVDPDDD